ncbi:MAG TPA: carbamoyltransferase [Micavibrio sp.]|nr:carbamoyltransferase [Micavibrio sp.]
MIVLGISAFYHDSAAALIKDGDIVAAAQEERFTRIKHDSAFPAKAIEFCLRKAAVSLDDVDSIVFFEKPLVKFERLVETYLALAPKGFRSFREAMPLWLHEKFFQKRLLVEKLANGAGKQAKDAIRKKLLFSDHHLSHAASAFFPSPFEAAVILTLDGIGEWASSTIGTGRGNDIKIEREIAFPHSLGLLYSAFTAYLGFKVNSGEYKVMGLAPYGQPRFAQTIFKHMVDVKEDGSFRLDQSYFDYMGGFSMFSQKFCDLFGRPPREAEDALEQFHMDMAASIQRVIEEIVSKIMRALARDYRGIDNLCLAGGVALNCVSNGRLLREGYFKNIWVQPAAGDSGGALGAALAGYYLHHKKERDVFFGGDDMKGGLLGPTFTDEEIAARLAPLGARFEKCGDILSAAVEALISQKAVGWFQGAMEYGPRALGARSILADARAPDMQKNLNLKIKFRESFRPFAPSVLEEKAGEWFDLKTASPYMMFTAPVAEGRRGAIPAVTHVDFSARIQTVSSAANPLYHALLKKFEAMTGCPLILNTSFNVRGEPIVCTPEDAFRCFMGCDLDVLAIGNYILYKEQQDPALRHDHKNSFEAD